ncbi:hypothetical protein L1049_026227 [Liquidambar formosana]|uniref:Uncharacterized protein n=1 Tax=Liquidambar formosana TaxID=63359 RepID=A0AAP0R687_LIQFO
MKSNCGSIQCKGNWTEEITGLHRQIRQLRNGTLMSRIRMSGLGLTPRHHLVGYHTLLNFVLARGRITLIPPVPSGMVQGSSLEALDELPVQ